MASESEQWRALAAQFQVICTPGRTPGAEVPGVLQGQGSCGHWVNVAGLRGWVRALLDQGVISFRCPSCPDTPWLWQELCKLGLFSNEDRVTLEAQILAQEGARDTYRKCPRCQNLTQCLSSKALRTPCLPCSQQAGELYCFCWGCRKDWTSPTHQGDSCSNPQCSLQAALYNAPEIQAPGSSAHGCPSLRACPECYTLVSHTGQGCSLVECPECWLEFCYRCLRDHSGEDYNEVEYDENAEDEDEGLYYDDHWEANCAIAGRQELNGPPQPKGDSRLTPASTPENSPPTSPDPDIAPSPTAPPMGLGTIRGLTTSPGSQDASGTVLSPGNWGTGRNSTSSRCGGAGAIVPSPGYWGAEGTVIAPSYRGDGALTQSPGSRGAEGAVISPRYWGNGSIVSFPGYWGAEGAAISPRYWGNGSIISFPGYWGAEGAAISPRYWGNGYIVPFPGYWGAEETDISSRYWSARVISPSIAYWGAGVTAPSYGCWGTGLAWGSSLPSSTRGDKPPAPPFL